ncbi:MAG: clostripain-related cysteine peptidase [Candidatus Helarchaeota archaeon]
MKNRQLSLKILIGMILSLFLLVFIININQNWLQNSNLQIKQEGKSKKTWTIMIYLDADNNLDSYGIDDLNEMERGLTSDTNINIIVLIDREYLPASTYYVKYDTSPSINSIKLYNISIASEPDMGDPLTLQTFIEYCITNYPADHYVLDLWDHGSGWPGICYDDTSDSYLTLNDIRSTLSYISSINSTTIDIIAMDACLMGMLEVSYSLENYSDILIASEETIPGDGFPYDTIISNLVSNPTQTPYDFASNIVDIYHNSYAYMSDTTLSAINLTKSTFTNLKETFDNFTNDMIKNMISSKINYDSARSLCQKYSDPSFIDLWDFIDKLNSTDPTFQVNGSKLKSAIKNAVINERHHDLPGSNGISIYFPSESIYTSTLSTYNSLTISTSSWDEFLNAFFTQYDIDLILSNYDFNDSSNGNNDGIVDPGEQINLTITLKNSGNIDAISVNGSLSVNIPDPTNITIINGFQKFGSLLSSNTANRVFKFNVSDILPNGTIVILHLNVNATFVGISGTLKKVFKVSFILGYDVQIGGDSFANAIEISEGFLIGLMPGPTPTDSGSAWFKINISKNKALNLNLTGFNTNTDFDAYIYDPDGNFVSAAIDSSYPDLTGTYAMKSGYFRIRIYPYNGTGLYFLNISISNVAYEDGRFFGTAFTIFSGGTFSGQTDVNGEYPDVFYRYWTINGAFFKITLTGDSGTDFDLYLYDSTFNLIDFSENYDYPEIIFRWVNYTGYVYIIVSPWSGSGNFSLSITIYEQIMISGFDIYYVILSILITLYILLNIISPKKEKHPIHIFSKSFSI